MTTLGSSVPFSSVHDMLQTKDTKVRHKTPLSEKEVETLIQFVESTKHLNTEQKSDWDVPVDTPLFQYICQKDKGTGLLRSRSWTRVRGVPPQVLFYLLYDPASRQSFDKYYVRFEVSRVVSNDMDILVSEVAGPIGLSNREFVEWRWHTVPSPTDNRQNGVYAIYLRSCNDDECSAEIRPKARGVERAETWISGYIVKWWYDKGVPIGSEVLVMSQIDTRGSVPKLLVNLVSGESAPTKWSKSLVQAAEKLVAAKKISVDLSDAEINERLGGCPCYVLKSST